jgi:hypothetical protein
MTQDTDPPQVSWNVMKHLLGLHSSKGQDFGSSLSK